MTRPKSVLIREVGPRDGFQNEPEIIPTAEKIRLIDSLGRAGLTRIEVASFVRPDVIPQLADGVDVLRVSTCPTTSRSWCSSRTARVSTTPPRCASSFTRHPS